jgi:hypothetical protein
MSVPKVTLTSTVDSMMVGRATVAARNSMSLMDGIADGRGFTGMMHPASSILVTLLGLITAFTWPALATSVVSAGMEGSAAGVEEEDTAEANPGVRALAVPLEAS